MQLGKTQPLTIVKKVDFGVYLAARNTGRESTASAKQVPEEHRPEMNWKYSCIRIPRTA